MQGPKRSTVRRTALALLLVAASAIAQDKAGTIQQYSGFLGDYSRLAPVPDNPNARRWVGVGFDFKPYDKILLEPVEVWVSPTSEYKGATPETLQRMTDRFTDSFRNALQPGYTLVQELGPGVLRIRLAVTGVHLTSPGFKPRDILPVFLIVNAARNAAGDAPQNVVLTGEMMVFDPNGAVVAAAMSSGTSDRTISAKKEITWDDLKTITDHWGESLRKSLDTARGL